MTRLSSLFVVAIAGLTLAACGDVDLGGVRKDAAPDVAVEVNCGPSPASRQCRTSENDCIPSICWGCESSESSGRWVCTADCPNLKPLCPGVADAAMPLDLCTGTAVKVIHKGETSSPAVTSREIGPESICCSVHGIRLHTESSLGADLELAADIVRVPATPGYYAVDGTSQVRVSLTSPALVTDGGRSPSAKLAGMATISGDMSSTDAAWQLGLCVKVDDRESAYDGLQIYVPSVNVAPDTWKDQFSLWLLEDPTLTGQDVANSTLGSLTLASAPILDLRNIDFVKQAVDCVIPGGSSSPCMWIGINTAFYSGSQLLDALVNTPGNSTIRLEGVPFVVVANGERIYMGAFTSGLSSFAIAGPEVFGEEIADDGFPMYAPNEHIVPGPVAPDLRNDPRILTVLAEAGKLVP